eukprot:scaffold2936_cov25-Tisochrysis_lutea.AAC.2
MPAKTAAAMAATNGCTDNKSSSVTRTSAIKPKPASTPRTSAGSAARTAGKQSRTLYKAVRSSRTAKNGTSARAHRPACVPAIDLCIRPGPSSTTRISTATRVAYDCSGRASWFACRGRARLRCTWLVGRLPLPGVLRWLKLKSLLLSIKAEADARRSLAFGISGRRPTGVQADGLPKRPRPRTCPPTPRKPLPTRLISLAYGTEGGPFSCAAVETEELALPQQPAAAFARRPRTASKSTDGATADGGGGSCEIGGCRGTGGLGGAFPRDAAAAVKGVLSKDGRADAGDVADAGDDAVCGGTEAVDEYAEGNARFGKAAACISRCRAGEFEEDSATLRSMASSLAPPPPAPVELPPPVPLLLLGDLAAALPASQPLEYVFPPPFAAPLLVVRRGAKLAAAAVALPPQRIPSMSSSRSSSGSLGEASLPSLPALSPQSPNSSSLPGAERRNQHRRAHARC